MSLAQPKRILVIKLRHHGDVLLATPVVHALKTRFPDCEIDMLVYWETADIDGWRKSMDDIAQFYFTHLPDSYAARNGRPGNVGVVGIASFSGQNQVPSGNAVPADEAVLGGPEYGSRQ